MSRPTAWQLLSLTALLFAWALLACRTDGEGGLDAGLDAGDAESDTSVPYDWFIQPVAGVVVGASLPFGTTGALYAMDGDPTVHVVPVGTAAVPDSSGVQPPRVTGFDRASVAPMQRLVISGERIRTVDAAISAYFEADGAVGVAVPAIAVTATSVEVAVPALFDSDGNSVAGTARVRIWQASDDGLAASEPFDGLAISALPAHPGGSAGLIYAAWLAAAVDDVRFVRTDESLEVPARFRDALAALELDLTGLLADVDEVIADAGAAVPLAWTTPEAPLLTPSALMLADRLVIAVVMSMVDELERHALPEAKAFARQLQQALDDCRRQSNLPELDDEICDLKREVRVARLGRELSAWGTRFLMSFYLGVLGGAGSTVAGAHSTEAAIAYEMTFAAGSGHVVSWATGTPPPSHAETQANASIALVDKLAEANGMLASVYSALAAGVELDAITRQWRDRIDDPVIVEPDAGDVGDAGHDVVDGGGLGGVYEGTFVSVVDFDVPSAGCEGRETATFYLTIASLAGSGTDTDPYTGDVDVLGQIETVLTGPHEWCNTKVATVPLSATRLTRPDWLGSPDAVYFEYEGNAGFDFSYQFLGWFESATRIEGDFDVTVFATTNYNGAFNGPVELLRQ